MRQRYRDRMLVLIVMVSVGLFPALAPSMSVKAADAYTEGYFHYMVEENAVTITEYFGSQNEVTVPSMIAQYPVAKISSGVFADHKNVQKVNLPDTITCVEDRAFGSGQTVVYDSNTEEPQSTQPNQGNGSPAGNGNENETEQTNQPSEEVQEGNVDEQEVTLPERAAMVDGTGRTISVDAQQRLIAIASDGTITVMDDSDSYNETIQEDGTVIITDSKGEKVTVNDKGDLQIPGLENKSRNHVIIYIFIGVLVLIAFILIFYYKRKRSQSHV